MSQISLLRRIAIIPARDKPQAINLAPQIAAWLRQRDVQPVTEVELRDGHVADALVALGGDGLMMRMAHTFPSIPLVGINFGKVGFLAMVERAGWQTLLGRLIAREFRVSEGPTLAAMLRREGGHTDAGWAINDVVVRSGMQMVDVELYVDGKYVNTYPGDGMIVASPQGSTAYCMAAGGPILAAGVRGFAVTPISAHSPIRSTLVVPEESAIELVIANDHESALIVDGIPIAALKAGDLVSVRRGEHQFRLIITQEMNFYEAFRSKFNYLIRPDAVPSLGHERERA